MSAAAVGTRPSWADGNDVAILWNLIHNCTRYTFDNAAVFWFPTDWSKRDTGPTFATTFSS